MYPFFRSSPLTPLVLPSLESTTIQVEKEGNRGAFTVEAFSRLTGALFLIGLKTDSIKTHKKICRLGAKHRRQKKFSPLQLWQGSYYRKEIESAYVPPVIIRWIDDRVGWGVFALVDLKSQEFIGEYSGILRPWRRSDRKNGYCFEYVHLSGEPTPFLIDAREEGGITRYINHSNEPNLYPTLATIGDITHLILLTKRPIKAGEQLYYDYGPAYWKRRKAPLQLNSPSLS